MAERLVLSLDRANRAYQISINVLDEHGHGPGVRLMGPKYLGNSEEIKQVTLNEQDAANIREMLDKAFPSGQPAICRHDPDMHATKPEPDGRIYCTSCDVTIGDSHDPIADAGLAAEAGLKIPVGAGAMPVSEAVVEAAIAWRRRRNFKHRPGEINPHLLTAHQEDLDLARAVDMLRRARGEQFNAELAEVCADLDDDDTKAGG